MAIFITIIIAVVLAFSLFESKNEESGLNTSGSGANPSPNATSSQKGGVNNPGFLIHTTINWAGKTSSSGCKFENFSNISWGVRAWYINLFGKVKKGQIKTITQMIDVLTPKGSENPEPARENYKAHVKQAKSWTELGRRVFDFEANPDWKNCSDQVKVRALQDGLAQAVKYCYGSSDNLPSLIPAA